MGTARRRVREGNFIPYGTLSGVSAELRQAYYAYGYRNDWDLPPLPEISFEHEPEPTPEEARVKTELRAAMNVVLDSLTPRERKVLLLRFEHNLGLEEIGKCFDVTTERIRQIEVKAIRKMRQPERCELLKEFVSDDFVRTTEEKAEDIRRALLEAKNRRDRMAAYEEERQAFLWAQKEATKRQMELAPEDKSWVDHLKRTNPELYESLQNHVKQTIKDFFGD